MASLIDGCGRNIDYLRISVTDRCNLRCSYCMPEGVEEPPYRLLSAQEILWVVSAAESMGIRHIRLTGGEPLLRPDLLKIVRGISDIGIEDISLTTNGTMLSNLAQPLKDAGLKRVNVSLDSLDPKVFRSITRVGEVDNVISGIEASIAADLHPVKINVVVMAGINDEGILDLARLSLTLPVSVRFIEVMPIGPDAGSGRAAVPGDLIRAKVSELGPMEPLCDADGAGPAQVFRLEGASGTVGFITPLSHPFCSSCNRIRLTPDGKLRPCLASDLEIDLLPALHGEAVMEDVRAALRRAVLLKPKGHELWVRNSHSRRMCQIGG